MNQLPTNPNPSDPDLVGDCLNGSTEAFGLIIDRYQKPIYNLCYRMTGSPEDAADLAQEAFLKAFQNLSTYKPAQKFFSWLYTIALNLCRNHLKRKKILRFFSLDQGREPGDTKPAYDPPSPNPSPADNLESKNKIALIKTLIDTLLPKQKGLMFLKFNDHLPDAEICKITGINQNNLRVQIHQAKKRLFEEYQKNLQKKTN